MQSVKKVINFFCNFKPSVIRSGIFAVPLSALSIIFVSADSNWQVPDAIVLLIYVGAAIALFFFVWAILDFIRDTRRREQVKEALHKNAVMGKLLEDYDYRTVSFAQLSFAGNLALTVTKG